MHENKTKNKYDKKIYIFCQKMQKKFPYENTMVFKHVEIDKVLSRKTSIENKRLYMYCMYTLYLTKNLNYKLSEIPTTA